MTEGMIMPTFSIIVPIYNVERFLNQCIVSILMQEYKDFEVILVDDGSPDNCPHICDVYSEKDNRVKVIHKENGGLVSARKAGLEAACGKYILHVDGDDYIPNDLLLNLHKVIDGFNAPDIISFNYTNVSFDGVEGAKVSSKAPTGYYCDKSLDSLFSKLLYDTEASKFNSGCLIYSIWSKAIKRNIVYEYQMNVDETITNGEDVAVVIPTILASSSLYVADFFGYYYRGNPTSMVHSFKKSELSSYEKVVMLLKQTSVDNINILGYGYRVFQTHLIKGARFINCPFEYVDYCKKAKNVFWDEIVRSFKQPNLETTNKIGVILIKRNMWFALWFIYSIIRK